MEDRALNELLYANDLVILADSMTEAGNRLNLWISTLREHGLSVNLNKTKAMNFSFKKEIPTPPILDKENSRVPYVAATQNQIV